MNKHLRVSLPEEEQLLRATRHGRARRRRLSVIFMSCALAFLPVIALAQVSDATTDTTILLSGPNFFLAVIAGLILAVSFQLILTNLSLAAGLNIIGPVGRGSRKAKPFEGRVADREREKDVRERAEEMDESPVHDTVRKISSAFGVWALVTASVALFFATWLSVELTFTQNNTVGVVLGLVIWGLFYVLMMVVEISTVSSLVGSLMGIATSGIRATYKAAIPMFGKSPEDRVVDTAQRVSRGVRQELFGDTGDLKKQIQKYIDQIKPAKIDTEQIRDQIVELFDDVEVRAIRHRDSIYDDETILQLVQKNKGLTGERAKTVAQGIKDAFQKIRQEASTDKDTTSKVADSAMRIAGVSRQRAQEVRRKFEEYLRSTGKAQLNPDTIKRDLEKLLTHPKEGMGALHEHLSAIDRDTIAGFIAQRRDIPKGEAEAMIDKVWGVVDKMRGGTKQVAGEMTNVGRDVQFNMDQVKSSTADKLQDYLARLDNPELDLDAIANDFRNMFSSPNESLADLGQRLGSIDRDTIKAMIAERKDISDSEAERIIDKFESVRDTVVNKANETLIDVKFRAKEVKDEALYQVDEARKTATTAAWWVLGSAVVSGIAAVVGGLVAASTGRGI